MSKISTVWRDFSRRKNVPASNFPPNCHEIHEPDDKCWIFFSFENFFKWGKKKELCFLFLLKYGMLKKMGSIISFSLFFLGVDNFPLRNMCECVCTVRVFVAAFVVYNENACVLLHAMPRTASLQTSVNELDFPCTCGIFNNKKCEGGSPVHACFQQLGLFLALFPPLWQGILKNACFCSLHHGLWQPPPALRDDVKIMESIIIYESYQICI